MTYAVYTAESFDKEVEKLSISDQDIIQKMFFKIKDNPYTSDQLRYKHLREKRIKEKRVYFLVYDDLQAVLIVALGGKKDQQATINHIVDYFDEYREYLERKLRGI
jgi:mRNA-degrading endonuclease RelE of RelBE toxin-antitoxin system